jgi:sugar/nucleoside kinase (ribokinase family)
LEPYMDYVVFNVIIDDIVFPDGRTKMGVLGGGGPQAAFGMRLWSDSVALVAAVGSDLPENVRADLETLQISLDGLYDLGFPTPRAWQVMEEDGRRTEIWRLSAEAIKASLDCPWTRIPAGLQKAQAYHMCLEPLKPAFTFLSDVHTDGSMVSAETSEIPSRQVTQKELESFLAHLDIFSPNISEAEAMLGLATPEELVVKLINAGATCVALRMGEEGALVADAQSGQMVHVPAVETIVVDPIGAGNAFCGGFLVGWRETGDLQIAGLYGSVSASFLVEQIGLPSFSQSVWKEARNRLDRHRSRLEIFALPKA